MPDDLNIIALICAHNEADVIARVVEHLIAEGVAVYLMDHASTDGTAEEVRPFLGRGVIGLERFPDETDIPAEEVATRPWRSILRRKEQLARELDADWFIHHDADEFREGFWEHLTLTEAIARVDRLGYNAIDFALYDFQPTHDDFRPGHDPREAFPFYAPGRTFDRLQVKCWKRNEDIDLVSSGGHDVAFPGRNVFPVRFLLRHYSIRGRAHGARKVFAERRPMLTGEHEEGWHRQFDGIDESHDFIRDPATLTRFDPEAVRAELMLDHRGLEEAARDLADCERLLSFVSRDLELRRRELMERDRDA